MSEQNLELRTRKANSNSNDTAIIMLHGYGASMDDLYPLADWMDSEAKWDWLFPNAPIRVPIGPHMEGRAWFELDMAEVERAMMSGTYRSYVNEVPNGFEAGVQSLGPIIKKLAKPYKKIVLGGFSQGGMMASHLALSKTVSTEALVLMSTTLVAGEAVDKMMGDTSPKPAVFLSHGEQDPVLSPVIAKEFSGLFKKHNFKLEESFFRGGHEIPPTVLSQIKSFLLALEL